MRQFISNTLVFCAALLLSGTCFAVRFTQRDYAQLLNYVQKSGVTGLSLDELSKYHVVFVGGYMNEASAAYFNGPEKSIRKYGNAEVTVLMPSSANSIADNIPLLNQALREAYEEGGRKPLLVIGHSKGGVESLATVLDDPTLVGRNIVAAVTTVQSPLTGCFLAKCSSDILKWTKVFSKLDGGHSLHPNEVDQVIREVIRKLPKGVREDVSARVFYVISKQQNSDVAIALKLAHKIISMGSSPENDGLVEKTRMWLRKFGTVIASVDADHMELVVTPSLRGFVMGLNTSRIDKNRAFTYLLLKSLLAEMSTLVNQPKSCQTVLY